MALSRFHPFGQLYNKSRGDESFTSEWRFSGHFGKSSCEVGITASRFSLCDAFEARSCQAKSAACAIPILSSRISAGCGKTNAKTSLHRLAYQLWMDNELSDSSVPLQPNFAYTNHKKVHCNYRSRISGKHIVRALKSGGNSHDDSSRSFGRIGETAHDVKPEQNLLLMGINTSSNGSSAQMTVAVRIFYSLVMYGGLAALGNFVCHLEGLDFLGTLHLNGEDFWRAILFSLPPLFLLLVLHQDSVVNAWEPARAIRDSEDEEIEEFFLGMTVWQYSLVGACAAMSEQIFFRSAVQGGIYHALQATGKGITESTLGMAAITGFIPTFSPCAQACAAVLTSSVTGLLFYTASLSRDPEIVVTTTSGRDVRSLAGEWHERQQLKKIYSPLLESMLSLYLSTEWIITGNLLSPMVTHAIYYMTVLRLGVLRLEKQKRKGV